MADKSAEFLDGIRAAMKAQTCRNIVNNVVFDTLKHTAPGVEDQFLRDLDPSGLDIKFIVNGVALPFETFIVTLVDRYEETVNAAAAEMLITRATDLQARITRVVNRFADATVDAVRQEFPDYRDWSTDD